jgi:hypothetical protein
VQKFPEVFIFASEKFEENWDDERWANHILASHDLERCDQGHPDFWVHDRIVLLKHVDNLVTQVIC